MTCHENDDNNGSLKKTSSSSSAAEWRYDAWNRIAEYKGTGSGVNATIYGIGYDALGRRVSEVQTQMGGGPYLSDEYQFYYSDRWQVIAEYNAKEFAGESFAGEQEEEEGGATLMSSPGGSATFERTYVWSPGYVDEMVLRDEYFEIDDPVEGFSSGDGRLYVQQDANFNVTSITSDSGAVQERYIYDPYGQPTYLDASWSNIGASVNNWVYLHQGGRLDGVTTLYHFRNRDYSPSLGRWVQQDPHPDGPYVDGMNAYEFVRSNPIGSTDSSGLSVLSDLLLVESPTGSGNYRLKLWVKRIYELLRGTPGPDESFSCLTLMRIEPMLMAAIQMLEMVNQAYRDVGDMRGMAGHEEKARNLRRSLDRTRDLIRNCTPEQIQHELECERLPRRRPYTAQDAKWDLDSFEKGGDYAVDWIRDYLGVGPWKDPWWRPSPGPGTTGTNPVDDPVIVGTPSPGGPMPTLPIGSPTPIMTPAPVLVP